MGDGFLLIEDDTLCARALRGLLLPHGAVAIATTACEARSAMSAQPWAGVVLDVLMPDGNGLDVLKAERAHVRAPILVFTGYATPEIANRAFDLRAELAIKPIHAERITSWARRVTGEDEQWLQDALGEWQRNYSLSEAELHVLELTVRMRTREEIARARQVSLETVKSHIKSLLQKSGDDTAARAAIRFLLGSRLRR